MSAAGIADLAAGFAVERRLVEHHRDRRACSGGLHRRTVDDEGADLRLRGLDGVAEELGRPDLLTQLEPHALGRRLARPRPGGAGAGALLRHRRLEAGEIDRPALLAQRILGEIEREAERIIEPEGDISGQRLLLAEPDRSPRRAGRGRGRASP